MSIANLLLIIGCVFNIMVSVNGQYGCPPNICPDNDPLCYYYGINCAHGEAQNPIDDIHGVNDGNDRIQQFNKDMPYSLFVMNAMPLFFVMTFILTICNFIIFCKIRKNKNEKESQNGEKIEYSTVEDEVDEDQEEKI